MQKIVSRKEMVARCTALQKNKKRDKQFSILFLILVPTLTIFFAGGLTPFVLITWLAAILFAGWISGAVFGRGNHSSDCRVFLPCQYECPMGYPEWCPNKNSKLRYGASPYEIKNETD